MTGKGRRRRAGCRHRSAGRSIIVQGLPAGKPHGRRPAAGRGRDFPKVREREVTIGCTTKASPGDTGAMAVRAPGRPAPPGGGA